MDALTLRVLADVEQGRISLDGNRNVRVAPDTVVDGQEEAAYIRAVRRLLKDELVMENWRAAEGADRELWLTSTGEAALRAVEFVGPLALVCVGGAFEAVAQ